MPQQPGNQPTDDPIEAAYQQMESERATKQIELVSIRIQREDARERLHKLEVVYEDRSSKLHAELEELDRREAAITGTMPAPADSEGDSTQPRVEDKTHPLRGFKVEQDGQKTTFGQSLKSGGKWLWDHREGGPKSKVRKPRRTH